MSRDAPGRVLIQGCSCFLPESNKVGGERGSFCWEFAFARLHSIFFTMLSPLVHCTMCTSRNEGVQSGVLLFSIGIHQTAVFVNRLHVLARGQCPLVLVSSRVQSASHWLGIHAHAALVLWGSYSSSGVWKRLEVAAVGSGSCRGVGQEDAHGWHQGHQWKRQR